MASSFHYQVFLSFRGEDTRKNFTDHLYTALVEAGFETFRDNNNIERGENIKTELQKAIQQSRISIIVVSKNYASSRWCLDELAMILDHKRTHDSNHVVLPVFYDVDPSDLGKQKFLDQEIRRLEEKFKAENHGNEDEWEQKVKKWRGALKELADLAGLVLPHQANGHEARFIKKIVRIIDNKMSCSRLSVEPYLIGMDTRAEGINLWLQDGSVEVGVLLLWGMGGIGKTTIAKYVYNLNAPIFETSSFLANVRETSEQSNGLVCLQKQLLSDILRKRSVTIHTVDEGIIKIKNTICRRKVLLVLDDVDHVEQLDAILGTRDWLHPGSKIIVTTRNRRLLKAHEIYRFQEVEKLDDNESFQLFSWHAFGQDYAADCYVEHSKKIVYHCEGHPLALKIFGSALSDRSICVWNSAIQKLEGILDAKILKKLSISYECLDEHDQNLFLHISCFFVGRDKEYIVKVLNNCKFYTQIGIENLIDRCLLTVDKLNVVRMHQLVQDMGREIVRQESPNDPGKRSRLWHYKDSFEVLKEKTGTEKIEGLTLDLHMFREKSSSIASSCANDIKRQNSSNPSAMDLQVDAFVRMHNLKLLQLNHVKLNGCYKRFPKRVRWLCWHGFPLKCIPSDFPVENLVVLDMQYSNLRQFSKQNEKFLGMLKILDLSYSCGLVITPDFSRLPNLEILILKHCVRLVEVHESVGSLEELIELNLEGCKNLKKLPKSIGKFKYLQTLNISGCSNIQEWPVEIRKIKSLKAFLADDFADNRWFFPNAKKTSLFLLFCSWASKPRKNPRVLLESLPHSLVSLSLKKCNLSDDAFPKEFGYLSSLKDLDLSENPITSLPEFIRGFTELRHLRFSSCQMLQSLFGLPNVKALYVEDCISIEQVTTLPTSMISGVAFNSLKNLVWISGMGYLGDMENVEEMISNTGWLKLNSIESNLVKIQDCMSLNTKKLPIQTLQEFGIFSRFFPLGVSDLRQFCYHAGSCSSVTTSPDAVIQGLNVSCIYATSSTEQIWHADPLYMIVYNQTKNVVWMYCPTYFSIPEVGVDMVWFSYWLFSNQIQGGDEVFVYIAVGDNLQVKGCCVQPVFSFTNMDAMLHRKANVPVVNTVSGDLSGFQVNTGMYLLCHHKFGREKVAHLFVEEEEDCTNESVEDMQPIVYSEYGECLIELRSG